MPTYEECVADAAAVLVTSDQTVARMTPREQAEAAWSPTSRLSVDELEDRIRAERGMSALDRQRHSKTA